MKLIIETNKEKHTVSTLKVGDTISITNEGEDRPMGIINRGKNFIKIRFNPEGTPLQISDKARG